MKLKLNRNINIFSELKVLIIVLVVFSGFVYAYKTNSKYTSKEISEIRVDKLNGENIFEVMKTRIITDEKTINDFISAINNKKKLYSKIDIRSSDYSITIVLKNKSEEKYNLWVAEDVKGILMNNDTVWELTIDSTNILWSLLK